MESKNKFDDIIKNVKRNVEPFSSDQKLVIIDLRNRIAVDKAKWFGKTMFFHIANNKNGNNYFQSELVCHISDFTTGNKPIGIHINYKASCNPGNEETLCEAFFDADSPEFVLKNRFEKWLNEYVKLQGNDFLSQYYQLEQKLAQYIKDKALNEVGLNLELRLSLKGKPETVSINIKFPVRLKDCDERFDIKLSTELLLDEENMLKESRPSHSVSDLEDIFKEEIQKHTMLKMTLDGFCKGMELSGDYEDDITDILKRLIKQDGRKIGFLSIEPIIPAAPIEFLDMDEEENYTDIKCRILEYPDPITVKNKLQLDLANVGKHIASKVTDIKVWVKEKLERIIREELFNAKYINILLEFDPIKKKIEEKMKEEAVKIGYDIKQIVTVPDLEPLKLKENFTIDTSERNTIFQTIIPNVKVKLRIIITARIDDLNDEKVKKLLNQRLDIKKLMAESVENETAQIIHNIDPQRYYMRFSYSSNKGEKTVESEIKEKIETVLINDYKANIINIVCKMLETDITERLKELQSEMCAFEIEFTPFSSGEKVRFKGRFQVDAIDENGWDKFQMRNYGIEEIKIYLVEKIQESLKTLPIETLTYKSLEELTILENAVNIMANKLILEQFGLHIKITNFARESTEYEKEFYETKRKSELLALNDFKRDIESNQTIKDRETKKQKILLDGEVEEVTKLKDARVAHVGMDGQDEKIKQLDREIKNAKGSVRNSSNEEIEKGLEELEERRQKKSKGKLQKELLPLFENDPNEDEIIKEIDDSNKEVNGQISNEDNE